MHRAQSQAQGRYLRTYMPKAIRAQQAGTNRLHIGYGYLPAKLKKPNQGGEQK